MQCLGLTDSRERKAIHIKFLAERLEAKETLVVRREILQKCTSKNWINLEAIDGLV
jgi:hypothetical protein